MERIYLKLILKKKFSPNQAIMTKQEYLNSLSEEEKKRYYKIAMLVAKKKKDVARFSKKGRQFIDTLKYKGVRALPQKHLQMLLDNIDDWKERNKF